METIEKAKELPAAFVERVKATHADADEFLAAIGREPFLSVRTNPAKWSAGCLALGAPVPWCADGFYLTDRPTFTLNPAFHAGAFYVQEASSMSYSIAIAEAMKGLPSSPVCLDLCAAPGGKTTLLLSRAGGDGVVVANEVVRQRAWILRENVAKWGCPSAIVTNKRPAEIAESGLRFDLITVDAPCSGEGMFRKDDVAVSEWTPKAAADCAARQRDILTDIWPALNDGGYMIYSTCTFNPDENERNMEWLVKEFGAEVVPLPMPEGVGVTTIAFEGGEGYAFYPHKVKGEGIFVCLLHKQGERSFAPSVSQRRDKKKGRQPAGLKETELGKSFVHAAKLYRRGDEVCAFPQAKAMVMSTITEALDPLLAGTCVGSVLEKRGVAVLSPAPELPLSQAFESSSIAGADVDEQNALKFLHGDSDLALPDGGDGWCVISHRGLALGLVKRMGNRLNNYYPKEWRIRMNVNQ